MPSIVQQQQEFIFPKADLEKFASLSELIEFHAYHNASVPAVLQAGKDAAATPLTITYSELWQAILRCSAWYQSLGLIEKSGAAKSKARPVALFMMSDVTLYINFIALMRIGIPFAFFSSRLSRPALQNLMEKIQPCAVFASSHLEQITREVAAEVPSKPECFLARPYGDFLSTENEISKLPIPPAADVSILEKEVNAYINHTSGTTGLPKPVYHGNKLLFEVRLSTPPTRAPIFFSAPLFHTYGLAGTITSLLTGCPLVLLAHTTVPTARSTIDIMYSSGAAHLATVPSILDDLLRVPNNEGIDMLRSIERIYFGGAPMKDTTGEILEKEGVKGICNQYGSTEVALITSVEDPYHDPDYNWRYVLLEKRDNIKLIPVNDGADKLHVQVSVRPYGWSHDFVLADLLEQVTPGHDNLWKILGRADDVLVLSNGEKVKPVNMEEEVGKHPEVRACVCFGNDRFQLGLLVELWEEKDLSDPAVVQAIKDDLWPAVQKGNSRMDKTGQIDSKNLIVLTTQNTKPFARTPKGSLSRKQIYADFEQEINEAYEMNEMEGAEQAPPASDEDALRLWFKTMVSDALEVSLDAFSDQEDLFELGMDSLQATALRRKLQASLKKSYEGLEGKAPELAAEFIFAHSTIDLLVKGWTGIVTGESDNANKSRKDIILPILDQYKAMLADIKNNLSSVQVNNHANGVNSNNGAIILLTGTTGSLGSFIVKTLVASPAVSKVICLNRPNASRTLEERQQSAFVRAAIEITPEEASKIQLLAAEVTKPNLGLDKETYESLTQVTHIMHNAWPVDWKRSVQSFSSQYEGVCHLLELAVRASRAHPSTLTSLVYTSSVSSAARYPVVYNDPHIPETFLSNPEVSLVMGYGEGKWLSEMLLEEASRLFPGEIKVAAVRVGQISASETSGSWPESENIPIMVKSCQTLGCIPDAPGVFTWTPVNKVADTMVDITLSRTDATQGAVMFNLDNPHPQPWSSALGAFAAALGIRKTVPYEEWLAKVEANENETVNPARKLMNFFREELPVMSSATARWAVENTSSVSPAFRSLPEAREAEYFAAAVKYWKSRGYLV